VHTHARQKTNPIHVLCLALLIAMNNFYEALRHPVAVFHCRLLKISTDRMSEEPLLFHSSFPQIQVNKLLKRHLFPFSFFVCSSGKLLGGCQITIKHKYSITPAQYCCQNSICCSTWIAAAATTLYTILHTLWCFLMPDYRWGQNVNLR